MDDVGKFIAIAGARLPARRKVLLLLFAVRENHAAPRGRSCFPSQSRLAVECDCSLATIKRDLQ
nr:helix-turn-helix domain-containing protein [Pseudomonadota bacterium]